MSKKQLFDSSDSDCDSVDFYKLGAPETGHAKPPKKLEYMNNNNQKNWTNQTQKHKPKPFKATEFMSVKNQNFNRLHCDGYPESS